MIPLLNDLAAQSSLALKYAAKFALLVVVFLVADRSVAGFLREGLDRYYGIGLPASVVCVGHSHTVLGIDKVKLESTLALPVAKVAVEGANAVDRLAITRLFLERSPQKPDILVYDVDAHTFTSEGLSSSSYRLLLPYLDNAAIREYVRAFIDSRMDYWVRTVVHSSRYNELSLSLAIRGWLRYWGNLKNGAVDVERVRRMVAAGSYRRINFDAYLIRAFEETLGLARSQGIKVVLLYIPTLDVLNRTQPELHSAAILRFRQYSASDTGIVFLDYNRIYEHQHEFFFDAIHMNPAGQMAVTTRLADDLELMLRGQTRMETIVSER